MLAMKCSKDKKMVCLFDCCKYPELKFTRVFHIVKSLWIHGSPHSIHIKAISNFAILDIYHIMKIFKIHITIESKKGAAPKFFACARLFFIVEVLKTVKKRVNR